METDLDVNQFLTTIYRYIQLGVHIKAYYSKAYGKFHREVDEVVEFYVDDDNNPQSHTIYRKIYGKKPIINKPSAHLIEYLENQNISIEELTRGMTDNNDPYKAEDMVITNKESQQTTQQPQQRQQVAVVSVPQPQNTTPTVNKIPVQAVTASPNVVVAQPQVVSPQGIRN